MITRMHWRRSFAVDAESFGAFAVLLGAELSSWARVLHRTASLMVWPTPNFGCNAERAGVSNAAAQGECNPRLVVRMLAKHLSSTG